MWHNNGNWCHFFFIINWALGWFTHVQQPELRHSQLAIVLFDGHTVTVISLLLLFSDLYFENLNISKEYRISNIHIERYLKNILGWYENIEKRFWRKQYNLRCHIQITLSPIIFQHYQFKRCLHFHIQNSMAFNF